MDLNERFSIFDNFITSNKDILEKGDEKKNDDCQVSRKLYPK